MKDLCKAMGIEWHDLVINIPRITCSCGVAWQGEFPMGDFMRHRNPSPTDEAFCWRVLQWLRSDWKRWDSFTFYAKEKWDPDEYSPKGIRRDFTEWLLDPARFIGLCDGWCRDHEEVKP